MKVNGGTRGQGPAAGEAVGLRRFAVTGVAACCMGFSCGIGAGAGGRTGARLCNALPVGTSSIR